MIGIPLWLCKRLLRMFYHLPNSLLNVASLTHGRSRTPEGYGCLFDLLLDLRVDLEDYCLLDSGLDNLRESLGSRFGSVRGLTTQFYDLLDRNQDLSLRRVRFPRGTVPHDEHYAARSNCSASRRQVCRDVRDSTGFVEFSLFFEKFGIVAMEIDFERYEVSIRIYLLP